MQVNIAPDAIVVRFAPVQPERVLNKAAQEYRRIRCHWVSVFAAEAGQGESDEAVAARLLQASELGGIDPARNPKYYTCRAQELLDRGFTFWKYDEEPDKSKERPEHYSVDLGERPTLGDASRFAEVFGEGLRRPR
jgi:hypothetical protein